MTLEERSDKNQKQTQELYALLGEFTAKFELVCFEMRTGIYMMVGGAIEQQPKVQALCAELTANPLLKAFRSIALQSSEISDFGKDVLVKITNRTAKLIERRNDIIHGTWFIGRATAGNEDFSSSPGFKLQNTSQGVRHKSLNINEEQFKQPIAECEEVAKLIKYAWMCSALGKFEKNWNWENNFVVTGHSATVLHRES
jgi:hypothetical protein